MTEMTSREHAVELLKDLVRSLAKKGGELHSNENRKQVWLNQNSKFQEVFCKLSTDDKRWTEARYQEWVESNEFKELHSNASTGTTHNGRFLNADQSH